MPAAEVAASRLSCGRVAGAGGGFAAARRSVHARGLGGFPQFEVKDRDRNWHTLESKLLAASAYDAGKQILWLRFRSGDVYRYFDFSEQEYRELLEAESQGRYFLSRIRNYFCYERLAKLQAA